MFRFVYTLGVLLFSLQPTDVWAAADPWDIKAPFKNGIITYNVSGTGSGTQKLYVRNWGKETVRVVDTTIKILFITQNRSSQA